MTPEERLARLEARIDGNDKWLASIDAKVDQLVAVSNMGKGAWFLLLKIGGAVAAVAATLAWIVEKMPHK